MADEDIEVDLGGRPRAVSILGIAALGAIAPFLVSVSSSRFSSVDGHTTFVFRDWVAVGGGAAAIVFGLLAIVFSRRARGTGLVAGSVVCLARQRRRLRVIAARSAPRTAAPTPASRACMAKALTAKACKLGQDGACQR